jgi:hypothetical protein
MTAKMTTADMAAAAAAEVTSAAAMATTDLNHQVIRGRYRRRR